MWFVSRKKYEAVVAERESFRLIANLAYDRLSERSHEVVSLRAQIASQPTRASNGRFAKRVQP